MRLRESYEEVHCRLSFLYRIVTMVFWADKRLVCGDGNLTGLLTCNLAHARVGMNEIEHICRRANKASMSFCPGSNKA